MAENVLSQHALETVVPPSSTTDPQVEFFVDPPPVYAHPFEGYDNFKKHPPIPVFNYIIDNKTMAIIEDRTGKP
jgi:hypothetical protein